MGIIGKIVERISNMKRNKSKNETTTPNKNDQVIEEIVKSNEQVKIWIDEIEFNNGRRIELNEDDIVVFVGPNNSGKSVSLNELAGSLKENNKKIIISKLNINIRGSLGEVETLIEKSSRKSTSYGEVYYAGVGYCFTKKSIQYGWTNYAKGLGQISGCFVREVTTENRLEISKPIDAIDFLNEPLNHPIHILYKNDNYERYLSEKVKQAFGTELIINKGAGKKIYLFIGERPLVTNGNDRVSDTYLEQLGQLPQLQLQGDGIRGFVGVLLETFLTRHSVVFIDEPEAFLHPPQARLLGKMIAEELPSKKQVILATHSEDFIKGLLDAGKPNVKILRITREGHFNNVSLLDNNEVKLIMKDSLLRYSDILKGLFHAKVVVCESDTDCCFYSTIYSALIDVGKIPNQDILFMSCGGKYRIPDSIKALCELKVKVNIIVDFDILNEMNPLRKIYEELGGSWPDIENEWTIVKNVIEQKKPDLERAEVGDKINEVLKLRTDKSLSMDELERIREIVRKTSPWDTAKSVGEEIIPSGDPERNYIKLKNTLAEKGIFVVEVGEIERFVKSVGNTGTKWLTKVLEKDFINDPELEKARAFISKIMS